ncbi:diguanylate cyclase [Shewanella sediminis HAW-EB3]|uniref:diguanylate cyclase n=1 Tax=Shewanella sediminis (strain HAW-EB3) TaxID=425104 RepID=A8FZ07_SHESH|nr:GGDEF domain-containing protein [Shewanella sediminis]ABV38080.1 diguanylate cyclase [Shewanella sediminis HAW-EB3]
MYDILPVLGSGLVISGALLLAMAIAPVWKIVRQLPTGGLRYSWGFLILLILIFIAGYVIYAKFSPVQFSQLFDLVVPIIFFGGAIFVFVVCSLSLRTTRDIMQNYALKQENITDSLMGIFNRRYLDRRLKDETERALNYSQPLSIFLIDIDHFKQVNDNYGHQVGDLVLKNIAQLIKHSLRESDVLARFGGEEFVVILPRTKDSTSYTLAERLRHVVEDFQLTLPEESDKDSLSISVTVSIGVAGLNAQCKDCQCLIENADRALYQAKRNGRNQVITSKSGKTDTKMNGGLIGAPEPR